MRIRVGLIIGVLAVAMSAGGVAYSQTRPADLPASAAVSQPAGAVHITIVHINDVHGHTQPTASPSGSVGGYARLATFLDSVRSEGRVGGVLFVHAGDEFSRGDELTTRTEGLANIAILNELKLTAMTPGNGEFYSSIAHLKKVMAVAEFPLLTANVIERSTGQPFGRAYVIENIGGVKVAIFGLCFVREAVPTAWPLKVDDPVETARQLVPQLRKQADVVIALTHIGVDKDQELAQAVDGIDVIIGGHTHTVLENGRIVKSPSGRDVLICQAGEFLKFAGRLDLDLQPDRAGRYTLTGAKDRLTPLDSNIKLDPKITALIARLAQSATQPAATQPAATPPASTPPTPSPVGK